MQEVIGKIWWSVGFQLCFGKTKVFWKIIRRLRGKRSSVTYAIKNSADNILTDNNEGFVPSFYLVVVLCTSYLFRRNVNGVTHMTICCV